MTITELLPRLEAVRQKGTGRWSARCPAHADRSPSLSVAEGHKGILIRCWAGCTLAEICQALGITQRELFYDTQPDPRAIRAAQIARERKAQRTEVDGLTADLLRKAEDFLQSCRGLDITQWSNEQLDDELALIATAYHLLETEELYEYRIDRVA